MVDASYPAQPEWFEQLWEVVPSNWVSQMYRVSSRRCLILDSSMVRYNGIALTQVGTLKEALAAMDTDGNGTVELTEYCQWLSDIKYGK